MTLIDLNAEREERREGYHGAFCACGSAWFDMTGVIDQDGTCTGYEWPPKCHDCGTPLESSRPVG